MNPLDKLGHEIEIGDYIVYGHAMGRCAGLRIGKVLGIKSLEKLGWTKLPFLEWRITVRGVDDDWNHREAELCKRNGTLMFPDRTIKVDVNVIPTRIYDLLKDVQ